MHIQRGQHWRARRPFHVKHQPSGRPSHLVAQVTNLTQRPARRSPASSIYGVPRTASLEPRPSTRDPLPVVDRTRPMHSSLPVLPQHARSCAAKEGTHWSALAGLGPAHRSSLQPSTSGELVHGINSTVCQTARQSAFHRPELHLLMPHPPHSSPTHNDVSRETGAPCQSRQRGDCSHPGARCCDAASRFSPIAGGPRADNSRRRAARVPAHIAPRSQTVASHRNSRPANRGD